MPLTIYVATSNPGKLRDFHQVAGTDTRYFSFLPLPGLKDIPSPPEDGSTFEENACTKAIAYSQYAPGYVVLADDSGLEVDALAGAPGVHSARFAADAGFEPCVGRVYSADERNNLLLIERLGRVPSAFRTARYHCVLAAARDGKTVIVASGKVEGRILKMPRGSGGFGYDPLFYLPETGRTMAEIDLGEKLKISHRGKALREIIPQLERLLL